jgi:hypothetical protein
LNIEGVAMKVYLVACAAAVLGAALSSPASAKNLPDGGVTVADVAGWLQTAGYQAKIVTSQSGQQTIASSSGGTGFHVGFYDCKNLRCGSIQFFAGFSTKGALNPVAMNGWNSSERWGRAYVDKTNDPWVEMDVDLTPGGTYELLDDEFATWRGTLGRFNTFVEQAVGRQK